MRDDDFFKRIKRLQASRLRACFFFHTYKTVINVYVHCILYLYVYIIITWKIFTTIFETVEHKNSLCCWSTPKKNRQKFWAISHGNFLRAFRISKKRLEYGRPVNLVKIRFRSGGFGGGWNFPRFHEFPGQLASPSAASTRERPGKKIRMQIPKTRKNVRGSEKKQKPWQKYLTQKKNSLCNICITSVFRSHFSWVFFNKKSLAPSPSRFLLGLGIGENFVHPKKTPKPHGLLMKKGVVLTEFFVGNVFLAKPPFFCLDSHFIQIVQKQMRKKKNETRKVAWSPQPPHHQKPAGNSSCVAYNKTEASSIGEQSFGSPNRPAGDVPREKKQMWLGTRWLIGWLRPLLSVDNMYMHTKF